MASSTVRRTPGGTSAMEARAAERRGRGRGRGSRGGGRSRDPGGTAGGFGGHAAAAGARASGRGTPKHGAEVRISGHGREVVAAEYIPEGDPVAVLVLAPGSGGGLGPGLTIHPQPWENRKRMSAHGGHYMRLGMELATGQEVAWDYRPTDRAIGSSSWAPVATLHFDYTLCPAGRLRKVSVLESAVEDMLACVEWIQARFPSAALILGGFSFGGPVAWATARRLPRGSIAGVASLAGSARAGPRFDAGELDTASGVEWHEGASLFVHGSHDSNVALQVAEYLYEKASEPRSLLVVHGSTHMFESAGNATRDAVYAPLRDWVLAVATRPPPPQEEDSCSRADGGGGDSSTLLSFGVRVISDGARRRPVQQRLGAEVDRMKEREEEEAATPSAGGRDDGGSEQQQEGETVAVARKGKQRAGQPEAWRQKVSQRRLREYCSHSEVRHELAGLVGYSE